MAALLGVTGSINCGKSTFCRKLVERGDACGRKTAWLEVDAIRARLLEDRSSDRALMMQNLLVEKLGAGILATAGHVDRRELSNRYYYDPAAKNAIDRIVDPLLAAEIEERIGVAKAGCDLVLLDWALLVERRALALADWNVLLVSCSSATQMHRLAGGDLPMDQLMRRIGLQLGNDEKRARALAEQAAEGRGVFFEISSEAEANWSEVDAFLRRI